MIYALQWAVQSGSCAPVESKGASLAVVVTDLQASRCKSKYNKAVKTALPQDFDLGYQIGNICCRCLC